MSHFLLGVILPDDLPAEDIEHYIERVLQPYSTELRTAPRKEYLTLDEVVQMTEHYASKETETVGAKFGTAKDLVPFLERWTGAEGGLDDDGLYTMTSRNPNGHWEWYKIGGRYNKAWDGKSQVMLGSVEKPEEMAHAFITPQGDWVQQGTMGWFGIVSDKASPKEWQKRIKALKDAYGHCEVVAVDCHQ